MSKVHWIAGLIGGVLWGSQWVAEAAPAVEQIQVPHCLASELSPGYAVLAEDRAFKILEVPANEVDKVSRLAHQVHCGRFMNISHRFHELSFEGRQQMASGLLQKPAVATLASPTAKKYSIGHRKIVRQALKTIQADNLWDTLTQMTTFTNRSATQKSGVQTAHWLKEQFERLAVTYGREDTQTFFVTSGGRYRQPSLVTVIGKDIQAPAVILGAHMDTLGEHEHERMPGAGDDGSGSATAMEVARVLLASDFKLQRPIYIIWYAAEEQGLVGSQQVVRYFLNHAIPVHAAIQFDMTGFRNQPEDKTIWVFKDYTDKELSAFMTKLIQVYINVPVAYSKCGYGCSDHASWTEAGIPAAFPCETSFEAHNPYIHTPSDTLDLLNLEHMTNFTRLGLAFAIELAAA
ncbi:aminopeptidase LapA [Legionella oakridgensis]|uniref:Aminopeptidase n=1 Tax=Legionella oakridgensis TaxID=29423 RepID=A0A0W0X3I0_9GAMM|nr:M20/M25/M40 family metallo-hydrolase [Legionella oakridgensis]ETO92241.1 putative aminopeptidase [Legionella oakridgensis RV-2-2007]KTD39048.1 aminopeptidase [Legionella oakridgensis]STY21240.1 aminopeptidase [Legionella longbeachae]